MLNRCLCLSTFVVLFIGACSSVPMDSPKYAPVAAQSIYIEPALNGSIYQAGNGLNLYGDKRAYRVGDIITVLLSEKTVSSKSGKANSDKSHGATLGGATYNGKDLSAQLKSKRSFAGASGADQKNSLSGNISVTVSEVLPNGLLKIRGEKWITLTRGSEFIRISGLVRVSDISPSNTIESMKLADARITYAGKGELAETTGQGWLTRLLHSPIMPF